jgi:hypothetical protein
LGLREYCLGNADSNPEGERGYRKRGRIWREREGTEREGGYGGVIEPYTDIASRFCSKQLNTQPINRHYYKWQVMHHSQTISQLEGLLVFKWGRLWWNIVASLLD